MVDGGATTYMPSGALAAGQARSNPQTKAR
jgi:hypothetical protein